VGRVDVKMKKLDIISNCFECSWFMDEKYCRKAQRHVEGTGFPVWCPLQDADVCFFAGGPGCDNVRLGVRLHEPMTDFGGLAAEMKDDHRMENPSQKDFIRFETEVLISLASRKPDNWPALVVQCVENIRAIMNRKAYKLIRGCCCVFDDNGNIFEACKMHADWKKQAEDRVRIQSLEGMIEILTKDWQKAKQHAP
jgi:hypothetical protein